MSNTSFPASAICYILTDIPGEGELQGTGVIIGPHTILTAAHLVYDGDTGASADAVSVYPGYSGTATTSNPVGALGGYQSIHYEPISTEDDELSAAGTQADFAIIDTSSDLSRYGKLGFDPGFTFGDAVAEGYPASASGGLQGTGGTVYKDGSLSDLDTSGLGLSPGYSGSPVLTTVERGGETTFAVAGLVSTGADATAITGPKVNTIRRWVAEDKSLYYGGEDVPNGLVPQVAGTVSGAGIVDAAQVSSGSVPLAASSGFAYTALAAHPEEASGRSRAADGAVPHHLADLVAALYGTGSSPGGEAALASSADGTGATFAAPDHAPHGQRHAATIGA